VQCIGPLSTTAGWFDEDTMTHLKEIIPELTPELTPNLILFSSELYEAKLQGALGVDGNN